MIDPIPDTWIRVKSPYLVTTPSHQYHSRVILRFLPPGFVPPPVGSIIFVDDQGNAPNVKRTWSPGMTVEYNDFVVVDGRWYQAIGSFPWNSSTTLDNLRPTHTFGVVKHGVDASLVYIGSGRFFFTVLTEWTPNNDFSGAIEAVTKTSFDVFGSDMWFHHEGGDFDSTSWGFEAIRSAGSMTLPAPEHVVFFRNRLVLSRGSKLYFSAPGDYYNFDITDVNGEVSADAGISVEIASGDAAGISWMVASDVLLIGTLSGEWVISEQNTSEPFGPGNIKLEQYGATGSSSLAPLRIDEDVLFFSRTRTKLRRLSWSGEQSAYQSSDLTMLSEHLGRIPFRDMTFQRDPSSVVWICNADGDLLGLTYDKEQDVIAWHRHNVRGDVRAVCSIASPDGTRDDLWLVVERRVNDLTVFCMEVLTDDVPFGRDIKDSYFLDCGASYDGPPATTISGLGYLEGQDVQVLVNGAVHDDRRVSGGSITLSRPGSKVHVGYHSPSRMRTMRIEALADDGIAQGKTKRIHRVTARVTETVGALVGPTFEKMDRIEFRKPPNPMNEAVPPYSVDKAIAFPGGYDEDGFVCVEQNQPLPLTIVALIPELQVNSR
jgi:hypothetical protein